ncbi:unnamed protein product [Phytophthora lilii]|uniref:Unnamed protein product n=1 Tax=Phytophthora lilii TaxID=2077276 RepID=A0A9W6U1X8_9STRA|nr:unnamed protein product [Phytophthora lilii]
MGNSTSWLAQSLCPEEQVLWVAAKSGDLATLREGLARLTPETRFHAEWRDPVYGYSPLANACSQGHLHCVQALLAYGVDCNVRDTQGNTPLHIATACGKSEVVRLLVETPAVDCFAKTSTKAQTALDIARQAYRTSEGRGLNSRNDNTLTTIVVNSTELLYRTSDGIQQSDDVTWLNRKDFRLSLKVSRKLGTSRASAIQSADFAASNQGELVAWKTFLTSLRVNPPVNPITTAFGGQSSPSQPAQAARPAPASAVAHNASPTQAALLQEQRDLERALRLSLEESGRMSRTHLAPSAPPPSDTMLETLGYSDTVVGPDGVEIVQLLRDDESSAAHGSSSPPPASSSYPVKSTTAQSSEAQDTNECVICFDGPQEAVCVPCGHNAVCMTCAQELLDTTRLCPVCRQQVREVIRLYRV